MANLNNQIKKLIATKMKLSNGETLAEQLKREVDNLYNCIQQRIDEYYDSYTPKIYSRTYRFQGAMYAENLVDIHVEKNQIKLSVRFHPNLAYHKTFTSSGNGYVPILLNYGFNNKKLQNYFGAKEPIEHLTHLDPQLFLENGILDWNRQNKLGVAIDVTSIYSGRNFKLC